MTPYKFGSTFYGPLPAATTTAPTDESGTASQPEKRRPLFEITLPTFTLSVAAFAGAWEYDDKDEDDMVEDERRQTSTSSGTTPGRGEKAKAVGVLEEKANTTFISGEVVIGKEVKGDVKVQAF